MRTSFCTGPPYTENTSLRLWLIKVDQHWSTVNHTCSNSWSWQIIWLFPNCFKKSAKLESSVDQFWIRRKNDQSWNITINHETSWSIIISEKCFQCMIHLWPPYDPPVTTLWATCDHTVNNLWPSYSHHPDELPMIKPITYRGWWAHKWYDSVDHPKFISMVNFWSP